MSITAITVISSGGVAFYWSDGTIHVFKSGDGGFDEVIYPNIEQAIIEIPELARLIDNPRA